MLLAGNCIASSQCSLTPLPNLRNAGGSRQEESKGPKSTRKKNRHGSALNFGAKWSSRNTCEQARNWLEARRECRREFFRVYRALGSNLESNTTKPGNRP